MRWLAPAAALCGLALSAAAAPPGRGWVLAWSDEFGGSSLNGSNWTIGTGSRRDAVNTASAVSVANGYLRVKTYTEGGTHYTGWIGSNGKFENCLGYWEARIRFSSAQGMWTAFWLQPQGINNVGDPAGNGTEIDIAEHRSRDSGGSNLTNSLTMNVHWDGYGSDHKSVGSTVGNPGVDSSSLQGNFHTYGLLWEPGRYRFYIDGSEVWTTTAAISQVRQWIYLTSEVDSGAWAGPTPGSYGDRWNTTTFFDVDHVRFYQRAEQTINGHFGHRMGPWRQAGSTSWLADGGRGGSAGARLNPSTTAGSRVEQTVAGLLPNTPYVVRGWGDVGSRYWPDIRFGARNHGGAETWVSVWSNGYTAGDKAFVTGPANSTADVFAWVPTQYGDCRADDVEIRRAGRVTNGGFESGDATHWSLSGDCFVHGWGGAYRRSGACALRLNTSAAARGAEHEIRGLKPSTTYTLGAWLKGDGQPVRLGVKNHGAEETSSTVTGSGGGWTPGSHTFTTGPSNTSATVFAAIPAGSNTAAVDVDDWILLEPPGPGWTAEKVGPGLPGEAGLSDGRVVVRGSGDNLGSTADGFQFVHHELAGPGMLTARLNSFEAHHDRAKAGIMLRASAAEDAPFAMVHWLPEGQCEMVWRNHAGDPASYVWAATATPWPPRLRLIRAGNLVSASFSTDGTNWTAVGATQEIDLPETALAGLAVTSHDTANSAEAVFSNVSFTGDRDADGIPDDYETNTGTFTSDTDTGTDPDNPDTDGDGLLDGEELLHGTAPLVANNEFAWQPGASPGGSGTWDATTAAWRHGGSQVAWEAGRTALFGGTAGTVAVAPGASGVAGMVFTTAGYVLAGTGPLALADPAFIESGAGITTIATPLAGMGALTIGGGKQVNLQGDNRGCSGTIIVDGNTQLRGYDTAAATATGNELGAATTTVEVRPGSQLRWYNVQGTPAYAGSFRISGAGLAGGYAGALNNDAGAGNPTRTVTVDGSLSLDGDATVATQNHGAFVINGPVVGNGHALAWVQEAAASALNASVQLAGLAKSGAGTLAFGAAAAPDIGTLALTDGALAFASGTTAGVQAIILGTNWAVNVGAGATFAVPSAVGGASTIAKGGAGTLVLAGANSFGAAGGTFTFGSGTTTDYGAIRLAHPQAMGNHARIALNAGNSGVSRLELSGGCTVPLHVDTVGRNTEAGNVLLRNVDGANTLQGDITITGLGGAYHVEALAGSALTITGNLSTTLDAASARDVRFRGDGDITLHGALADSATTTPTRLDVTKEGAGTLVLTGTCTHSGATVVGAGTLRVDGALAASAVDVAATGTLAGTGSVAAASVAGRLAVAIGADPLDVAGTLALAGATLALTGTPDAPVHVLVNRGSLAGSFAAVTGLPAGYTVVTSHGGTAIALVRNYEAWAAQQGLDPLADGAPGADKDGDGQPNLLEFALFSDPHDPASRPALEAAAGGGQLALTYRRAKQAAGTLYQAEWSTDLLEWSTAGASDLPTGAADADTLEHRAAVPTAGATRLFLRLRVSLP